MTRLLALPAALLVAVVVGAQQPAPKPGEVAALVAKLGSQDFEEREAATKRLEALGVAAVEELRAAVKSDDPETARRAADLLRKAERQLANDKTLAPTLVELDATDKPLDDILADLSKQARCEVVLNVPTAKDAPAVKELAVKKFTVSTAGKVPFWEAVLKVCAAADLQVAGAGGVYAPGSIPQGIGRASGVRAAKDLNKAVVLEARDARRRPATVSGAILVEAVAFPKNLAAFDQPAALLQAWPEPRLQWEGVTAGKVAKAASAAGDRLAAEFAPFNTGEAVKTGRDGMVLVRNPDGSAAWVRDTGAAFQLPGGFRPNIRQAVVQFKKPDTGPAPVAAKDLSVSLFATVRGGVEPLCRVAVTEPNKSAEADTSRVGLWAIYEGRPNGRFGATVLLSYETKSVRPATVTDELPGARGGADTGNHSVYGVRVTDAGGKPYTLGMLGGTFQADPTGKRTVLRLQLELHPDKEGHGPPDAITLWGTVAKPVEVRAALKDVELTGGK